ncbi:regulation of transformation of host cell by virus [Homalodisca vitripennis]|nr:regulation of transformation of host cell by virus [Homalodisca vitripennis]
MISGSMAMGCEFQEFSLGETWDETYQTCCTSISSSAPPVTAPISPNTSFITPASNKPQKTPQSNENICDLLKGELCAHICIPVGTSSYRCDCEPGFSLMADGKSCQQDKVQNRCEINNPCQQRCTDTGIAIECSCLAGFQLAADNKSCSDVDECALGLHDCGQDQTCQNEVGTFTCQDMPRSTQPPQRQTTQSDYDREPDDEHVNNNTISTRYQEDQCPFGYIFNIRTQLCQGITSQTWMSVRQTFTCAAQERCVSICLVVTGVLVPRLLPPHNPSGVKQGFSTVMPTIDASVSSLNSTKSVKRLVYDFPSGVKQGFSTVMPATDASVSSPNSTKSVKRLVYDFPSGVNQGFSTVMPATDASVSSLNSPKSVKRLVYDFPSGVKQGFSTVMPATDASVSSLNSPKSVKRLVYDFPSGVKQGFSTVMPSTDASVSSLNSPKSVKRLVYDFPSGVKQGFSTVMPATDASVSSLNSPKSVKRLVYDFPSGVKQGFSTVMPTTDASVSSLNSPKSVKRLVYDFPSGVKQGFSTVMPTTDASVSSLNSPKSVKRLVYDFPSGVKQGFQYSDAYHRCIGE